MKKTNYSRIEEALTKEVDQIKVNRLLKLADGKVEEQGSLSPKQMLLLISHELNWLKKQEVKIFKTLAIPKEEVTRLIEKLKETPLTIEEEDIPKIKAFLEKILDYKESLEKESSEEDQIEKEREKHVYKRHNVRDKWLPLDTHADLAPYRKKREK